MRPASILRPLGLHGEDTQPTLGNRCQLLSGFGLCQGLQQRHESQ